MIDANDRERWLTENLEGVGRESFPDDEEVHWNALGIRHADEFSFVEARPEPATVGYAGFGFVFDWSSGPTAELVGCYVSNGGRWSLLSSKGGEAPAWKERWA